MIKILTIIGARPQIIKAAALSRAIRKGFSEQVREVIVHTGQHYDERMSAIFFEELQIPRPDYNLQVGSGKHGEQTARMVIGIEDILEKEQPDYLVIYGDTNSTLAAAVAASKLHVPIVHIEAGLRSFNKKMPEEVNRILSDHVSTYLFPPTNTGYQQLQNEGFDLQSTPPYTADNPGVFNVGDVMYDNTLYFQALADTDILHRHGLQENAFLLATLHRNHNTDDAARLNAIFRAFQKITQASNIPIVLPLHPRTLKQLELLLDPTLLQVIRANPSFLLLPPASFLEMIQLEKSSRLILTDSGGVQKEAYFLQKPCIILRSETEWVEIVQNGAALLCDADENLIWNAYHFFEGKATVGFHQLYGNGDAAEKIIQILLQYHHK